MKHGKIYFSAAAILLMITVIVFSCKKAALDTSDPNNLTTGNYYKTAVQLKSAVNAAYAAMHQNNLVSREWYYLHDTRSDEVTPGGGQLEVPRRQLYENTDDPTNSVMNSVWNGWYTVIFRANVVTDNAPNVTDNVADKNETVGEAKFLRGWAYFDLVSMWGGVPLLTTVPKSPAAFQPRASVDAVYAQIIQDLTDAAAALPAKSATDKGRATAAAANAMLGRVLMQKGDYAGAKAAFLKIPTTGPDGYALTNRYLDNFELATEFNPESIFEVVFVDKGDNSYNWGGESATESQSTVRNQEYCPVAWRNLIPSDKYLNEFESTATGAVKTDPRFSYSVYQTGDMYNNGLSTLTDADQNGNSSILNGVTKKISWRKFMLIYQESAGTAGFHPGGNNQRIIRYSEVLINLAECANELGDISGAVAYLNMVRARPDVAMPPYPTAQFPVVTKEDVVKAIMHEKMVELGDEQVRNIDILRWRKKGYFSTEPIAKFHPGRDELLPIPQSELDNNPLVAGHQNPGY
ncbi:RagB/SusD family nutrient uptake outer membrane protein [Mucilaginibacter flavidus]|uniref:RagB/SusD family nutrient uptake outer membrane protein n=1 Tax=Mucilaginibacter flavidus TaxID=2949309 RepID=UPI0020934739|nr:RagB/SusD family nutrient uptake outer membrane protein [Mucilaginibacter flavidus]MCO5946425.1 RagB/SusD family nutrient uptake outer membrane protein [Mucilaginibacter flavidus]